MNKALMLVNEGQVWINNKYVQALLLGPVNMNKGNHHNSVSNREYEIIQQLSLGKKNKDIADGLYMSEHTVKAHMSHIFKKFKVSNRVELITVLNSCSHRNPEI